MNNPCNAHIYRNRTFMVHPQNECRVYVYKLSLHRASTTYFFLRFDITQLYLCRTTYQVYILSMRHATCDIGPTLSFLPDLTSPNCTFTESLIKYTFSQCDMRHATSGQHYLFTRFEIAQLFSSLIYFKVFRGSAHLQHHLLLRPITVLVTFNDYV